MRISERMSVVLMGLVSGLLTLLPIAFAEQRDELLRIRAADATFVSIDPADASSSAALGINTAGTIVGRYVSRVDRNTHGFMRDAVGQFTIIDYPQAVFTVAAGINSHGDVVGQYRLVSDAQEARHGFVLSRGVPTTIDFPGALFTNALGINGRGEIVGRYCTALPCSDDKRHGFLLSRGSFIPIDIREALGTNAWDINSRSEIVGGYLGKDHQSHVFRLREAQLTTIDFRGAFDTARDSLKGGINSRGDIVSYYCVSPPCGTMPIFDDSQHGFLQRDGETTTTMDFPQGHVTGDFGINARGDIVGVYNDTSNIAHGFLLKVEERERDEED
jgi:uncharacterized membrane protein